MTRRPDTPIAALIRGLPLRLNDAGRAAVVHDLTDDSRQAGPGVLFVSRGRGERGGQYLDDAVARGSRAVVVADRQGVPDRPGLGVARAAPGAAVDQALAGELAQRLMGRPARRLKLLGVTGTNGKTTTAMLIQHLLRAAGVGCGLIGTVVVDVGCGVGDVGCVGPAAASPGEAHPTSDIRHPTSPRPAALTTPGAIELTRLLAEMVAGGCDAAVMEVSSHALHQGRTDALDLDAGVFTNLSGDHLDYHRTLEAYADAKARLFERLGADAHAVVNLDDPAAGRMLRGCEAQVVGCRVHEGKMADGGWTMADRKTTPPSPGASSPPPPPHPPSAIRHPPSAVAHIHALRAGSSEVTLAGPWGEAAVTLPLTGRFNVSNALQAAAAAWTVAGVGAEALAQALAVCPQVPGRVERVTAKPGANHCTPQAARPKSPTVLVDYAHTDDALENVLAALRPLCAGRLIVVFGCGGDRDVSKRPRMARVAQRFADIVIVTSDNPRTEDPEAIIAQVVAGFVDDAAGVQRLTEPDRAAAIDRAVAIARAGDTVLIAGKGHEDYQVVGKVRRRFDDREHAAEALKKYEG